MEVFVPELAEIAAKLDTIINLLSSRSSDGSVQNRKELGGTMTVKELSEYLGISESTVYKYTSGRLLPFLKIGRRLLFRAEDIDEWVKSHFQESIG